jgi:HD-GYP domain-containing protein (c-di-GMP phosphodiesterase class II)
VTIRRLLVLIVLAQVLCIAVGLSFHQLYITSALRQVAEDEARSELRSQLRSLDAGLAQQDLSSLRQEQQSWQKILTHWRTAASPSDQLYLLDPQGRVVAAAGDQAIGPPAGNPGESLRLVRANAEWGKFGEPIRGLFKDASGGYRVAIARGLASEDGYLMLTRMANDEKISPASLQGALWLASGITLVWTSVLQAATVFLIISFFKQRQSREQAQPDVEGLKQAQALLRTQETVIFGLAKLSDSRDADTGSHLERIAHYSSALAAGLRQRPEFREQITPGFVQLIAISSALHDIGKVGVEDSILRKPGPLTADERSRMECHTQIGEECLQEIERRLGSSNFLQMAREISSAHHERWDGQGYPLGLAGERIPLSARIVALADVYDALSCKRVYKEALPHEQCVSMIADASGTHFDPRVVEVFLQIQDRFRQIWQQFHTAAPAIHGAAGGAIESDFGIAATERFDEFTASLHEAGQ